MSLELIIPCYALYLIDKKDKEGLKERIEKWEKLKLKIKDRQKQHEKQVFIRKFIDEIPDLSYYEAVQLKNKLGQIYLEWNDE
jgi:hypothetical protein